MPYRQYALWLRPTARCEECGAPVRLRGFWTLTGVSVLLLVLAVGALAVAPAARLGPGAVLLIASFLLAIDYVSYHLLIWESAIPLPPAEVEPRPLPGAGPSGAPGPRAEIEP
jgi:hypothetical protein